MPDKFFFKKPLKCNYIPACTAEGVWLLVSSGSVLVSNICQIPCVVRCYTQWQYEHSII